MNVSDAERLEAVYGPVATSTRCKRVRKETVEAVVELAVELAREGREGRKIGTLFVIGDVERVLERSRPLLLDPLYGPTRPSCYRCAGPSSARP